MCCWPTFEEIPGEKSQVCLDAEVELKRQKREIRENQSLPLFGLVAAPRTSRKGCRQTGDSPNYKAQELD